MASLLIMRTARHPRHFGRRWTGPAGACSAGGGPVPLMPGLRLWFAASTLILAWIG